MAKKVIERSGLWVEPGVRFTRLKVEHIVRPRSYAVAIVRCDCGVVKQVAMVNLITGRVKSCGCWKRERSK